MAGTMNRVEIQGHSQRKLRWLHGALVLLVFWALVLECRGYARNRQQGPAQPVRSAHGLRAIVDYINASWDQLTRSTNNCQGVSDSKLAQASVLYVPAGFQVPAATLRDTKECKAQLEHLPFAIREPGQAAGQRIDPPGLLFLPNPYVVPGGRFNEMYGWDSYFIIRGLLRSGKVDLARGMVENFFFEIEHYGAVLNANRTYYLTRSQPPFLSSMIMAVYDADKASRRDDRAWLARAYRYVEKDYEMWTREPHLAGTTGLSRYYDFGDGPVPEGLKDEAGYYHDVLTYFLRHGEMSPYLLEAERPDTIPDAVYRLQLCQNESRAAVQSKCEPLTDVALSREYYKGDRSMRESGFDITFRFGPYGADTHHYVPVCLNSLLYKTETDLEKMSTILGDRQSAIRWHERSVKRRALVQNLLWNQKRGMYFDYNFEKNTSSSYEYLTTFYPLWVGIATDEQARAVASNLHLFEHDGGLAMSTRETGVQWDLPYGWAPLQLIAVEGLRRYGFNTDADRVSTKFLSMVLANFERDGTIREKYNVVADSSNVAVAEGYRENVVGFGWTNGVFLELLKQIPLKWTGRVSVAPTDPGVRRRPEKNCRDNTHPKGCLGL